MRRSDSGAPGGLNRLVNAEDEVVWPVAWMIWATLWLCSEGDDAECRCWFDG